MKAYIPARDQGKTGSREAIIKRQGGIVAVGQRASGQRYPRPGRAEHDSIEFLQSRYLPVNDAPEYSLFM